MSDTTVRNENGTLAVSILQHVREDAALEPGEAVTLAGEKGVFVAMSDKQLSIAQQRAIRDEIRAIVRDGDG